jgi:hypothetical protein
MSRSVKQDFDTLLRKTHHVYAQEDGTVRYIGATIPLSDEQFYLLRAESDSRYERTATQTVVASTSEDWAKYHLAKRALLTLNAYENTTGAEEVEVPCPKPKTVLNFTETHDEWIERCHQMYQAERQAA